MLSHKVETFLLGCLAFIAMVQAGWIGKIEGQLMPVMADTVIEYSHGERPFHYRGSSRKIRDCEWIRTEWYLGQYGDKSVMVQMKHNDPPKIRGMGEHTWDDIEISLPPKVVESSSYAIVTHDCWNGALWLTKSVFYSSK